MDPSGRTSRIVGVPRLTEPPTGSTQSVSVEVVRVLGPGRFLINYGGRSATAFSSLDLQPGQVLKAQLSEDGQGLIIRVPTTSTGDALSSILRELAIPDDAVSRRIVEALLRTGLGLSPDRLAHLRTVLKAYGESTRLRGLARLAALLEDKGLDPGLSDALFEPIYGSSERDESGAHSHSEEGGEEQSDRRGASGRHTAPVNHEQLVEHISAQLRALLGPGGGPTQQENSTVLGAPERPEADLLRLFNHIPGKIAHWVVVPFRLRRGEVGEAGAAGVGVEIGAADDGAQAGSAGAGAPAAGDVTRLGEGAVDSAHHAAHHAAPQELAGQIRLRLDSARVPMTRSISDKPVAVGSGANLVVLDVQGEKGRWWCEIRPDPGNERFRVVLRASSEAGVSAAQSSLAAFRPRFSAAGISIDSLLHSVEFDGFSSEAAADIIHDVDTKA